MIPAVEERADWQDLQARFAEVDAAEQRITTDLRAAVAEHEARMAAWRDEAARAQEELRPAPEPPEQPEVQRLQDALRAAVARRQTLMEEQRRLLARLAPVVEEQWQAARPHLAQATREALAAVPLEQWREWLAVLLEVRTARDNAGSGRMINGPAERMPQRVDLADLCVLARHADADLLAPAPVPAPPAGAVQVDRGEPEALAVARPGRNGFRWGR